MLFNPFLGTLWKMWRTSVPHFLSSDGELQFLGATVIMLHQHFYTEDFLKEYGPYRSSTFRTTAGPDHFKMDPPEPPDLSNLITQSVASLGFSEDPFNFPFAEDLLLPALSQW